MSSFTASFTRSALTSLGSPDSLIALHFGTSLSLSAAAELRANEVGAPPIYFNLLISLGNSSNNLLICLTR